MKLSVRRFVLFFAALLLLNLSRQTSLVSAQQKQLSKPDCPVTQLTCPAQVFIKERLQFTADVRGGDPKVKPIYNWMVSAGTIESGQGTPIITVSTTELTDGEMVTATVEVKGFDRECGYGQVMSSCSSSVAKKAEARKLDEYGKLMPKEENKRLDKFTVELQKNSTSQAYIIAYGGRTSRAGEAQKLADKAKNYLVSKRGLDAKRIVTVAGGYREQPAVELWLVPSRAQLPKATPTIQR
jgi:hypothetical protein